MNTKAKIAIAASAVVLSLFAFNLFACSACIVDLIKGGVDMGCEVIVNVIDVRPDFIAAVM